MADLERNYVELSSEKVRVPFSLPLLTQNAPTELRGGIISFDRLIQQVSKTVSTSVVGLLLIAANLSTIFWILGILSFISVGLMALLLPNSRAPRLSNDKSLQ